MSVEQLTSRGQQAAAELAGRAPQFSASDVVDFLSAGLNELRDLLIARLHSDVELEFGKDSMIAPVSASAATRQILAAGFEIEVFAAGVIDNEMQRCSHLANDTHWIADWVLRLRLDASYLASAQKRLEQYLHLTSEECRRGFVNRLYHVIPESVKTPLVLWRLFPLAVRLVAAHAFGDSKRTEQLRNDQRELLPAISDCPTCHGRLLETGSACPRCGNPVWTFEWLQE
jgi:hypothetical protein